MSKTIIFCADGTWNGSEQDDNDDGVPELTNVYKLFSGIAGTLTVDAAKEQEKELKKSDAVVQVAKYIHGVGDFHTPIRHLLGGAFGSGMIKRIVRGYTFISRNYEPDDGIVIVGFSRGAYTARALAGLIVSQGLLAKHLTADKERSYRTGAKAWYCHQEKACRKMGRLQKFASALADLPAFVSRDKLKDEDFVEVDSIAAVGVWDTVGALGLPHYIRDPNVDAFKFVDTQLSPKVQNGFHAVALDEQRRAFAPSLWEQADNVDQVVFPGAHADVGGGYPSANNESGLSDIALQWMAKHLQDFGVQFSSPICQGFHPDPLGTAHQPWRHPPFNLPGSLQPRDFTKAWVTGHPSINERMGKLVIHEPNTSPIPYAPKNWPKLAN